jgi:hypothetical protein
MDRFVAVAFEFGWKLARSGCQSVEKSTPDQQMLVVFQHVMLMLRNLQLSRGGVCRLGLPEFDFLGWFFGLRNWTLTRQLMRNRRLSLTTTAVMAIPRFLTGINCRYTFQFNFGTGCRHELVPKFEVRPVLFFVLLLCMKRKSFLLILCNCTSKFWD